MKNRFCQLIGLTSAVVMCFVLCSRAQDDAVSAGKAVVAEAEDAAMDVADAARQALKDEVAASADQAKNTTAIVSEIEDVMSGTRRTMTPAMREQALEEIREQGDVNIALPTAMLTKGLLLFNEKEYVRCIPYLEEAVSLDPSLTSGWEGLGWAYWRINEEAIAIELWERFLKLMPNNVMPYNLLAQAAILHKEWLKADGYFRKSIRLNPEQYDLRFWFAQNLLRVGKMKEAERVFRDLVRDDPDRYDVWINLAQLLVHNNEYDEAAEIWRRIVSEFPDQPRMLLELAIVELNVGELERADELCSQILEMDPTNLRAMTLRADLADLSDRPEETIVRLEKLLETTDDDKVRASLRVRIAARCKRVNERSRDKPYSIRNIIEQLRLATVEDPANIDYRLHYAANLFQIRSFDTSRKVLNEVLVSENVHNIFAKDLLFEIALVKDEHELAEQIIADRYKGFGSKDPMRFYQLARVAFRRGEYTQALSMLDKMEDTVSHGGVLTLLYHQMTESDWMPVTSSRRLFAHVTALKESGFELISPADIPKIQKVFAERREAAQKKNKKHQPRPWLARVIDSIYYQFMGEARSSAAAANEVEDAELDQPIQKKYVAVTFDDGIRTAFQLGGEVARELGVPFGMFVITKPQDEYQPSVAGWDEVLEFAKSGNWIIGSHLEDAHELLPIDETLEHLRHALPNRIYLEEKQRLESMNEWDRRMRNNFRFSRKRLAENMKDYDCPVPMVAYPFGDVGQTEGCNISTTIDPVKSILTEAAWSGYRVGFVQTASGYTFHDTDPLTCARYEPEWFDEGADVVNAAYVNHPLFMMRKFRIEIAYMLNKPHLAREMIALMAQEGYPADLVRELELQTHAHFTNKPYRPERPYVRSGLDILRDVERDADAASQEESTAVSYSGQDTYSPEQRMMGAGGSSSMPQEQANLLNDEDDRPWLALRSPYLGAELWNTKANDEYEVTRYGVMGGLAINQRSTLSAEYFWSRIKQSPTILHANLDYYPGSLSTLTDNQQYLSDHYTWKADRDDWRARWSYLFSSGTILSLSFGQAKFAVNKNKSDPVFWNDTEHQIEEFMWDDPPFKIKDNEFIGDIGVTFYPMETLTMRAYFIHDLVPTASHLLTYNSVGFNGIYKISDTWQLNMTGQYWIYEDDNALFYAEAESMWEMDAEKGLWFGVLGAVTSASDPSIYYWTPYWDERLYGVFRYRRAYEGSFFMFDALAGFQQEETRDDPYLMSGGQNWKLAVGFGATFSRRFWNTFDLFIEARTMFLQSHADHSFRIGGTYNF